ncbi:MAG: VacJ family lipoprotein [Gammaproteobacteria bacterium]|jgi:phospholipid-binding lipoprotein MlaA
MKTRIFIILLSLSLYGCATTSSPEQAAAFAEKPMITDPFEPINRKVYSFNKGLDTILVKPIAEGYVAVVPPFARSRVEDFFANIEEISVFVNTVLQARFEDAGITAARFAINSTLGVLGLFDVAESWGMPEKQGDFGQTFYVWGVKRSVYLMLPVLGPTTGRETVGKVPGYLFSVWDFTPWEVQTAAFGLMAVDIRSQYLDQEEILNNAFDEYSLIRDIYIRQRETFLTGTEDVTDWDEDLINEHEVY